MTNDRAQQWIEDGLRNPQMMDAALALSENRLADAEPLLRAQLARKPTDVAAIRLMAELAARVGRLKDSETLLRRALDLAPSFGAARANLATVLYKQSRFADAVNELDAVLASGQENAAQETLKAAALGRIGGYEEAIELYRQLTARFPEHAKLWMSFGHMLKTVGDQEASVAAYRRALQVEPTLGEVYWSLANLKTVRFSDEDVAVMEAALATDTIGHDDRFHLHFALGKAYEERQAHEIVFAHYAQGNALRSSDLRHDPDVFASHIDEIIAGFTPMLAALRNGQGDDASDPIFILGMPRAGSTLIEQILASHSMVEGTMELPDIPAIALREGNGREGNGREGHEVGGPSGWVKALDDMAPTRLAELGAEYLERTRIQRKTAKPFFIDKLPNNWVYTGFIHLILPNAKIIDARRHPLDCCFSNFRQHYAKGQGFSYNLVHMGRYYADYVRMMAHVDSVLPGRIHRVIHEHLLDNPEQQIRLMLDYLGLPFEEACLDFHKNKRAVRTASSEQVRRPINRDGVDQWKPYEAHLEPLKAALGKLWNEHSA